MFKTNYRLSAQSTLPRSFENMNVLCCYVVFEMDMASLIIMLC